MNATDESGLDYHEHIDVNPAILVGKPVIKGTRVPVSLILNLLGHGASFADIVADYPILTVDDIRASILYAEARLDREDVFLLSAQQ
jgi:uncharacterized protein (DUF433 family)